MAISETVTDYTINIAKFNWRVLNGSYKLKSFVMCLKSKRDDRVLIWWNGDGC